MTAKLSMLALLAARSLREAAFKIQKTLLPAQFIDRKKEKYAPFFLVVALTARYLGSVVSPPARSRKQKFYFHFFGHGHDQLRCEPASKKGGRTTAAPYPYQPGFPFHS